MKIDKELKEVWEMKEQAWKDTRHLKGKKLLDYILNDTKAAREKLLRRARRPVAV